MAVSSQSMLKTAFPLYAINSIGDQYIMISGGGGAAKTGVLNTIEIYKITPHKSSCILSKVFSRDMGRTAPMNVAVIKKKNHLYNIAIGLDNECHVFDLRCHVVSSSHPHDNLDHMEGVRNRRKPLAPPPPAFAPPTGRNVSNGVDMRLEVTPLRSATSDLEGYQKCVDADLKTVCTGGVDGRLRVFKLPEMKCMYDIKAHTNEIDELCMHPITKQV